MKISIKHIGSNLGHDFRYSMSSENYEISTEEGREWLEQLSPGNYEVCTEEEIQSLLQAEIKEQLEDPERKKFRNECDHRQRLYDELWTIEDNRSQEILSAKFERETVTLQIKEAFTASPEMADMFISIVLDDEPAVEYAARTGQSKSNVSHKMSRAKKKLKNFFNMRQL
ncbi:MAG: hypothetical protein HUJ54_08630 [Erysipelotrichaceae bacterium]|nr:hypothetical protein [Erysipelotrichaceae bacterium]